MHTSAAIMGLVILCLVACGLTVAGLLFFGWEKRNRREFLFFEAVRRKGRPVRSTRSGRPPPISGAPAKSRANGSANGAAVGALVLPRRAALPSVH